MHSDEENNENIPYWRGTPATILLINVFDPLQNLTANVALEAACQMLRHYMRSGSDHNIGICLYGVEDSSTSVLDLKGVTNIFPLTVPTLDDFKKLLNTDLCSFKQAKDLTMSDTLWHCSKMFANYKKQLSNKTVVILSPLDITPSLCDQDPTLKRVEDLVDAGVTIKIINISVADSGIDPFYRNFLIEANIGKDYITPEPILNKDVIEKMMIEHSNRHLAVAKLNFELGSDVVIGVGVYNLLKSSSDLKKSNLDRKSNTILSSMNKTLKVSIDIAGPNDAMEVDEPVVSKEVPLLKSEVLHCQNYGDEKQQFTNEEKKIMQNPFGIPGLKLLGYKPQSMLCKAKWFLKQGYFLFPNESIVEGSIVAFKAMHKACQELSVVAICVLCTRVGSRPYFVALSPTSHPLELDIEIGFDIIPIPFVENVRNIPSQEEDETPVIEAEKSVIKDILEKLRFDYKADMFENPVIQSKYRAVEAIALDEEHADPFIDTTKRDPSIFQEVNDDLFQEIFGPFGVTAVKRAGPKDNTSTNKRHKADIDEAMVDESIRNETVDKFTVDQLKKILKLKSIPGLPAITGLKKKDLVDLVYNNFK